MTTCKKKLSAMWMATAALLFATAWSMPSCGAGDAPNFKSEDEGVTPAEDSIGERLFLDTRFAQYFAAHMTGVNQPLAAGDPVVDQVYTTTGTLPGPFAGQSMNCRSCHFVTEFQGVTGAGNRTYSDFTTRSPIPLPMNGYTLTPRNSMHMVGSLQPHPGPTFLHFDGEFATPEDLVKATMTGRNFGWAPTQYQQALAQAALIVRGDDGSDQLAKDRTNSLSYGALFLGTDKRITSDLLIPAADRHRCEHRHAGSDSESGRQVHQHLHGRPPFQTRRIRPLHRIALRRFPAHQSSSRPAQRRREHSAIQSASLRDHPRHGHAGVGGRNLRIVPVPRQSFSIRPHRICRPEDFPE